MNAKDIEDAIIILARNIADAQFTETEYKRILFTSQTIPNNCKRGIENLK